MYYLNMAQKDNRVSQCLAMAAKSKHAGTEYRRCDVLLPFLLWMDSDDLRPACSAMEPEPEAGPPRRKTPERRLVWRRIRLLLGCLTVTASADLQVEELLLDEADLNEREG